jgi:microsomal dipeptidase-like Zn-dependent dipeptidase
LDGNLANIDRLYDAGVRMMAPTHFFDNDIGGSSAGVEKTGLTDKGREMVRRMEARHMLVDVAHAAPRTIDDVLAIATRPVIVSHTGVKATCDNSRNLSDAQLRGIAHTGGVIGIAFFEVAVCGTDAAAIARAIRHAADTVGVDAVALGSDFDGAVVAPFDTTGLGLLIDALYQAGFTDGDIGKIMGGNALRVLLSSL